MANENGSATSTLVVWGAAVLICVGVAIWCIVDGWFRPGFESAEFNRYASAVAVAGIGYCIWRGAREYKQVTSREGQETDEGPKDLGGAAGGSSPGTQKK